MSTMADEMQRRLEADGGAGLADAPVPGTEGAATPPPPSAETLNADTRGGTPETIPYSRFKEVNDELQTLRGFKQLQEWGYDPDSLGRLASFEAAYYRDPTGTWKAMADNLDLPQEVKDSLERHLAAQPSSTDGPAQGEPSAVASPTTNEPPEWAKPLIEDHQRRAAADEEQSRQQMLDSVISHWNSLDEKDQIKTPPRAQLNHIVAISGRGQWTTVEQLAEAARQEWLDARSEILGAAVQQRPGLGTLPAPVPGSGVGATPAVNFGGDIRKATMAAKHALEQGQLPSL